jgi:hypothetical protein
MALPFDENFKDIEVYLKLGATDFRKGIPGLQALIIGGLNLEMKEKRLFAFCAKDKKKIKIIYLEGAGIWLIERRIRYGSFAWPEDYEDSTLVDMEILRSLLTDPISVESLKARGIVENIEMHL